MKKTFSVILTKSKSKQTTGKTLACTGASRLILTRIFSKSRWSSREANFFNWLQTKRSTPTKSTPIGMGREASWVFGTSCWTAFTTLRISCSSIWFWWYSMAGQQVIRRARTSLFQWAFRGLPWVSMLFSWVFVTSCLRADRSKSHRRLTTNW